MHYHERPSVSNPMQFATCFYVQTCRVPEAILWAKLTKGSQRQEGCCLQSLACEWISPYHVSPFHSISPWCSLSFFFNSNSPVPRKITKAHKLSNNSQARRRCSAVSVQETFLCERVGSTCSPKAANSSQSESNMKLQTIEFSSNQFHQFQQNTNYIGSSTSYPLRISSASMSPSMSSNHHHTAPKKNMLTLMPKKGTQTRAHFHAHRAFHLRKFEAASQPEVKKSSHHPSSKSREFFVTPNH